jgi:phage terminase large subunit-like protein
LLARDWHRGFLGVAAKVAKARYERAIHAEHWMRLAAEAAEPQERWGLLQLGIAAADRRQLINVDPRLYAATREIGGDVPQRLSKAVEKASQEEKKTLLGIRKPSGLLDRIMRV